MYIVFEKEGILEFPDSISPADASPPEAQPQSSRPSEEPAWDLLDVLLTVAFAYVSFSVLVSVVYGIVRSIPRFHNIRLDDILNNAVISIPVQLLAYVLIVGFMVLIVRIRHDASLMAGIGWNEPDRKKTAVALCGGLGLAILSQIVAGLLSRWTPTSLPMERFFQQTTSAYVASFFAVFVAPVFEELFFRGFLYPALARRTGVTAGIWLTAIAFAMLHGAQLSYAWAALVPILIVGLALTIVRAKTKSVALSVLVHASYNGTLLAFTLVATHGFRQSPHL